jgi:hypothetical protein
MLGVILTPYGADTSHGWYAETTMARGGQGRYLPQPGPHPRVDRFHNTRGEVGFYYDSQLGAIPTDAELAKVYQCYTPVASGWINTKQGYIPPPWRFGWDPAGKYGPQTSLSGVAGARAQLADDAPQPTAADVLAAMNAHNQRVFMLSVVSTVAVSISALFAFYRNARLLRRELGQKKRK